MGRPRILLIGLIGYVASLLLLLSSVGGLWAIYALRAAAGVFVAGVAPIVPTLVAARTPKGLRARRLFNQGLSVALPAMSVMRETKELVSSLE